ncbi:intraflagellar transport-associated protein isoform X8 [Manis javanica]|uniref:intraflagellar transport-associated protein isoform X8 n=1 Tax=Manis javanica TaxID=9974 RepID=UPI00187A086B|nr:intraflagellar transport-associated protein isoform X9 [Manis javanica]
MTAQASELEIMDEDRLVEEVLDKFVNCHEQTYEEFLSTFTHLSKGWLLLPGEVEQQVSARVPSYVPSVAQPVTPGVKPRHAANGAGKQMDKILGDEVQPFSLDEEFDYDTVLLTPKFTPAETDAIKELSKQKRKNTDAGVEEPCD